MSPSRSWRDVLEVEAQAPPLPCEFDECCPSQNWTYRDEDMGGTVAAISRRRGGEPCLPFGVCLCFFPLASFCFGLMPHDLSHLRKIQLLQLPEIHCANSCLNTNFHSGLLHEEKKEILVKQTLAHICFLFISLPMPWALAGTHYILASSRIWKSPTQRKDFYTEERKPPQRMHSFCKGQIS